MTLSDIISDEGREAITRALRSQDNAVSDKAADIIDQLVKFATDEIYLLDEAYNSAQGFLEAETDIHKMYPNTATCRSGPGVVAGQAFTRHCGASCSNPVHAEDAKRFHSARGALFTTLEKIRNA